MNLKNKKQKLPKWFNGEHYSHGETVRNPFSGASYELNGTELSMYDFIKGCEIMIGIREEKDPSGLFAEENTNIQNDMMKALDWFRKNNAKAYMALLD